MLFFTHSIAKNKVIIPKKKDEVITLNAEQNAVKRHTYSSVELLSGTELPEQPDKIYKKCR